MHHRVVNGTKMTKQGKVQKQQESLARHRLRKDLLELQRDGICSVAALPLEQDIFEWHVNIKPNDGVYSGVYFHLIMKFPKDYPASPPTVEIKTPISHPNIFGSWLCLSMIKKYTAKIPYEGWSGAYSVSSILMQLQSFLFAEKIDQDYGGQANAQLSDQDVVRSLETCKTLKCACGHSHDTPWPPVKGPPESLIKVFPTDPRSGHVQVQGSACQTTHTYWVGAYGEYGVSSGKVQYEAFINWTGDKWARDNIRGGLCRFGFGSQYAMVCGRDRESFGYGGTGKFSWNNNFSTFGESFTTKDTITVAVDFDNGCIYFAKNGRLMILEETGRYDLMIPRPLQGVPLYPILSFKNSRAEFNFGSPRKPCLWLQQQGFRTMEEVAAEEMNAQNGYWDEGAESDPVGVWGQNEREVDWHHEGIIPELWLSVFCGLSVQDLFAAKFVCKSWHHVISRYNISDRLEISCFFTKNTWKSKINALGIGLQVIGGNERGHGSSVRTQMDIISERAWRLNCRTGVWGENLTHFLPLVLNRSHSSRNEVKIEKYLLLIADALLPLSRSSGVQKKSVRLLECLVTMMNQIVVQFTMESSESSKMRRDEYGAKISDISMNFCEKVVMGYCALHHLLLWLLARHRQELTHFVDSKVMTFLKKGSSKKLCPDLGKFLIYLMISRRAEWPHVAARFIQEVFTRNVRWMVNDKKYRKYDTTEERRGRSAATFRASQTSRRLVLFQVWFMKNCSTESLQSYNDRLGRPRLSFQNAVLQRTRAILACKDWGQYFDGLGVKRMNEKAMDQLLRFAVGNSVRNKYHGGYNRNPGRTVNAPKIPMIETIEPIPELEQKEEVTEEPGASSPAVTKPQNTGNTTNIRIRPSNGGNPWNKKKSNVNVIGEQKQSGSPQQELGPRETKKMSKSARRRARKRQQKLQQTNQ